MVNSRASSLSFYRKVRLSLIPTEGRKMTHSASIIAESLMARYRNTSSNSSDIQDRRTSHLVHLLLADFSSTSKIIIILNHSRFFRKDTIARFIIAEKCSGMMGIINELKLTIDRNHAVYESRKSIYPAFLIAVGLLGGLSLGLAIPILKLVMHLR